MGIELETLSSHDELKLGGKNMEVYQMLMQHIARDNSGLILARRKDATCFLSWIMSVMTDSTIQACQQRAIGSKTMERSDYERQNMIGKPMSSAPIQEENDAIQEKMTELEPLLEASGERNLRRIDITHGECPCHCLAQTVSYRITQTSA